ncbi:MAG: mechanosensitive ion channel family protein [Acidobacteriota bacterium]|nr:mechanosensitive ion channel family protein [Acidobacteriota bacterium]MDE3190190.1 mechanosensitive ion channel family protein [Acidobacteriota bacterium]
MPFWHRIVIAAVVFAAVWALERLVDLWLRHKQLPPEAVTRYRVLRRSISAAILVIGLFSALLVIPEVRAIAGGLLASSAVLALVVGFASQQTLSNFVAGILIAITQPVRLGDRVTYGGIDGVVEEIGVMYTFIRSVDGTRLVVPNSKLSSDSILNSSIRNRETFAEITVQLPLTCDLDAAVGALRDVVAGERTPNVSVTGLDGNASVTLRASAPDAVAALKLESDLRLRAHAKLRALGVWT